MRKSFIISCFALVLFTACSEKKTVLLPKADELIHTNVNNLTDLIIYDIFSPPVASRIYVYASLAAHEAIRHQDATEKSIVVKLKDFAAMPEPEPGKKYNFVLSASKAFYTVAGALTFSKDTLKKYEAAVYGQFKEAISKEEYENSIAFGDTVAKKIMERAAADNYKKTRALEKYYGSKDNGKWQPTAPDYLDGVEPYWNQIATMVMDSASQFNPGAPPAFNASTNSQFYKMNKEVYDIGKNLSAEEKDIAKFWDDNPFVMEHSGHLMMATKKQTPGGHWMGIATIACRQQKSNAVQAARTYAYTALALFEGFISVFDTKYKYAYVRPISFINQTIDPKWEPLLQTPPFPEYTSGHSTITASAATILTGLYGENFAFKDTSDKRYINMERNFSSFLQASDECSLSRLLGGIHYRVSIDKGAESGRKIGAYILQKIR